MADDTRDLRQRYLDARLVSVRFVAGDGHMSTAMRSNEEAAGIALAVHQQWRDEELVVAEGEVERLRRERDAVLRGEHVPLSDLEAAWRVGAERERQRDDYDRQATQAVRSADFWRAEYERVRDRADAAEHKLAKVRELCDQPAENVGTLKLDIRAALDGDGR